MTRTLIVSLVAVFATTAFKASAQVPKLSSNPTASATIFLDFDGQTVSTPYWNGGRTFYCTPSGLTETQITTAFYQVAEDFNPFNLNVTTDSTVYFNAPINQRQRIIVTAYSSWYGSAGGVAYLNTFRWGMEIPGFVFANLLNYNEKNVAEASSHESGHTLGLNHQTLYDADCNFKYEYNPGSGTNGSATSWAPIMGNSYGKTLTLWHKGTTTSGCNTLQDDLAILSDTRNGSNGFGYKSDLVGNTTRDATVLPMSTTVSANSQPTTGFNVSSEINTSSDVDIFRIDITSDTRLQLSATPSASGSTKPNVDMQMTILDSRGNTINTYNPASSLNVSIDSFVTAGTYYLRLTNASNTNVSNYGMLGDYTVAGAALPSTLPVHSMKLNGKANNSNHELNWSIVADEPIESISIETSTNGMSFSSLQNVTATVQASAINPRKRKQSTTAYWLQQHHN